jgi:hypothetical protein
MYVQVRFSLKPTPRPDSRAIVRITWCTMLCTRPQAAA